MKRVADRILAANTNDLRLWGFITAILIYAVCGLPTPDNPGWPEMLIGGLLVFAVGLEAALSALKTPGPGMRLLAYGLSIPVFSGLARGHDPAGMIRDIIPFLFMMLPLFLAAFFRAQDKRFLILQRALVITGIVLSVRALAEHVQVLASFLLLSPPAELTYLANAPTILFAALLIAGTGAQKFIGVSPSLKSALTGAARMTLALFVFLPVAMTLQRAGIGYALLFAAVLAALGVKQAPYRTLMLAGILALLLAPLYGAVTALMEMAMAKTGRVGFNMRFEEIAAVWHEISAELPSFLFGRGWGAEFASPAVGGIRVNYTHGLLSSALLKTGLAGFALTLLYLAPILRGLAAHIRTRPVLVLALAGPILIDLFFYASFKSLDFGLVLLLAAAIPPASSSRILEVAKPD